MKGPSHDGKQERSSANDEKKQADLSHASSQVVRVKIEHRPVPNRLRLALAGEFQEQSQTCDQDRDTCEYLCRADSQGRSDKVVRLSGDTREGPLSVQPRVASTPWRGSNTRRDSLRDEICRKLPEQPWASPPSSKK